MAKFLKEAKKEVIKDKKVFKRISFKLEEKYINIFENFSTIEEKTKEKLLISILNEVNFLKNMEDYLDIKDNKKVAVVENKSIKKEEPKKYGSNYNTFKPAEKKENLINVNSDDI